MIFLDLDFGYFLGAQCGLVVSKVTIVQDVDRTWTQSICMGYQAGMPEAYIIAEDKRAPQYASQRTPLGRSQKASRRDETRVERKGTEGETLNAKPNVEKIFSNSIQC
jgi:hypothetical protein